MRVVGERVPGAVDGGLLPGRVRRVAVGRGQLAV
ncbi:MAG: hypothetical protein JWN47_810, partial [Frankiales bacterium]|nr:hypothetical protein [Frankiales bacterium]